MSAIVVARPADESEVVALWRACGLVVAANDPGAEFRFAVAGSCSDVLLARSDNAVAATAMVGHDGHRGWIYYLAVGASYRLRGLGRDMVQASEAWMRERGVPKSQLMIREGNARVTAFYERLGYAAIPRVTMQKVLTPHGDGADTRVGG